MTAGGARDFEFRLLGSLELAVRGRPLALGAAKQRALLAVLLLRANRVVSSDRLIEDIWGEAAPSGAGHTLQVYVSELRKAFREAGAGDETPLVTKAPGYLLRVDGESFDLSLFERLADRGREALEAGAAGEAAELLRRALSLWRGPPLAEFVYAAFAQNEIARLEELRLAVLEERIAADLALGRHGELVGELTTLVADNPLRERLRAHLMLALYRAGRQADALNAYRSAREILVEELGIEPGRPLQELERAILRQDPALDLAGTEPAVLPRAAGSERSLLVVARGEGDVAALLAFAEPLARIEPARELILASLSPRGADVEARRAALAGAAAIVEDAAAALRAVGVTVRSAAFTSAAPGDDVVRLASEQDVDLILLSGSRLEAEEADPDLSTIFERAPCDVALLVARQGAPGAADGVLVPFGAGEHDWAALELGAWYARAVGSPVTVAGVAEGEGGRDASRALANASLALQRAAGVSAQPLLLQPGSAELLAAAADKRLVAVGLSQRWGEALGPVRAALVREARPPVTLVRRGLRPGGLAPSSDLTHFTWSLPSAETA